MDNIFKEGKRVEILNMFLDKPVSSCPGYDIKLSMIVRLQPFIPITPSFTLTQYDSTC